ncbi:MAG: PAS domain-containing sensor histidine kinase [Proteobacteria bacterium]|nr:PAS domain-containing sensor histidine kinase [Pseudomonadota bacterium]
MTPTLSARNGPRQFGELCRTLVDELTDYAIYFIDLDGTIRSWNAGATAIFGYAPGEVIGRHVSLLHTKADRLTEHPLKALKAAAEHGRHQEARQCVRQDGTVLATHATIHPQCDDAGEIIGFAMIVRDATTTRQTERALHESERRLRLLVEGISDYAIYMLDANGIVTSWNLGAERIKGYAAGEVIGQHFSRFYTEEDQRSGKPHVALDAAAETGRYEEEAQRVRRDGTQFAAHVVIYAIRDEQGRVAGYAKITRDITERKQREHAELANAAKSRFLAHLSHEFRTPLNAIIGFAEIIKDELFGAIPDKRYVSFGKDIHYSGLHLLGMVNDILDLTRVEAGKIEAAIGGIELRSLTEQSLRLLEPRAAAMDIALKFDATVDAIEFKADERMVRQCIFNLVDNALKFSSSGSTISVVIGRDESWVHIRVIDQGVGMAEEDIPTALEPFRQLGDITKRPAGGAGLGLSLVKSYCELHGGTISIRSARGVGTEVTLRFPYPGGKQRKVSAAYRAARP